MNLATMQAVYQALDAGLAIPVTRSWPHTPPALPGCTYHLASWQRQEDGAAKVVFQVFIRTELHEQGDLHAQSAVTAMLTQGYVLFEAKDSFESETGVFVRSLTFVGLESAPLKPPDASPDFHAAVFGSGLWHALPEPLVFSLEPATRGLIAPQTPGFDANLLPPFALERVKPATLFIQAPYQKDLTALTYLRLAFRLGNEVTLQVSYRDPEDRAALSGVLTAFHASPLGIRLKLALREL